MDPKFLKEESRLGSTVYHDLLSGRTTVVPWGLAGWLERILVFSFCSAVTALICVGAYAFFLRAVRF